jgi:hypothetical protein
MAAPSYQIPDRPQFHGGVKKLSPQWEPLSKRRVIWTKQAFRGLRCVLEPATALGLRHSGRPR